ncbi:hypothetical protein RQP54_18370 [Curvibacter sp. APW13]|uniref:hypothetical protein n=1 Tax=Curvibacter sp. APW13 TaxID=3077236 RepID=UPI0028DEF54E|nr:hypothetical protein [Curvibacter sp. APW13]MDT8992845.1 hypothetical protein [Curvibacter sp. APW13]
MKTIFFLPTEQFARFERLATMLAESTFGVPEAYRGDVGSCLNAVDIAHRLNVSPLVVLQNVRDVGGRPSFTYQFAKALIEDSGVIVGSLQYETMGELQYDGTSAEGKPYQVRAFGTSPAGETLVGPWITWRMAELERWTDNPQYISMPEVMFRARATTFFYNQYASSLMMGFQIEGDPSVGGAKAKPATAVESLTLPVIASATAGTEVFAAALAGAPQATPTDSSAAASTATPVQSEASKTTESVQGAAQQPSGGTAPAAPAAGQGDAPRPRKARVAKSAGAPEMPPPPPAEKPAAGHDSPPPALVGDGNVSEAPPSDLLTPQASAPAEQETSPSTTVEAGVPVNEVPASSGANTGSVDGAGSVATGNNADSMERFSEAFAKVDATTATGASLKESMSTIALFSGQDAEDLYLVLLGIVVKQLTAFIGRDKGLTPDEGEFVAAARELNTITKEVAATNADVANRRSELRSAYTGLLSHLESVRQRAAA